MKKKLQEPLILLSLALSAAWMGLAIYYAIRSHDDYCATIEYRGHSYILLHADGTNATTHDPDCPCHMNGTDKP